MFSTGATTPWIRILFGATKNRSFEGNVGVRITKIIVDIIVIDSV
jgi:hypothetical protein